MMLCLRVVRMKEVVVRKACNFSMSPRAAPPSMSWEQWAQLGRAMATACL